MVLGRKRIPLDVVIQMTDEIFEVLSLFINSLSENVGPKSDGKTKMSDGIETFEASMKLYSVRATSLGVKCKLYDKVIVTAVRNGEVSYEAKSEFFTKKSAEKVDQKSLEERKL